PEIGTELATCAQPMKVGPAAGASVSISMVALGSMAAFSDDPVDTVELPRWVMVKGSVSGLPSSAKNETVTMFWADEMFCKFTVVFQPPPDATWARELVIANPVWGAVTLEK